MSKDNLEEITKNQNYLLDRTDTKNSTHVFKQIMWAALWTLLYAL